MIRVLQVGFTQNLGGIEMIIMNIYRNIDRTKVQFDFIDNCGGIYYADKIHQLGGRIISMPTRRENFTENKRIINELMKAGEYTAVHCNCLAVANIDFVKAALKYKKTVPIVHSHQDMKLRHLKSEILHRYNRIWMANKDIIRLACSEKAAYWIHGKRVTNEAKVQIIHNAIEIDNFRYDRTIEEQYREKLGLQGKFVIGCVGRFAYQKNYEFLANVFAQIIKKEPNAVLVCVGGEGGMQKTVLSIIDELGIRNSTKLLGIREDVDRIIQTFDAFVLPSRWEGLGIVYIEAQAAGVMTFASDVVPRETCVTDLMHYISLKQSPEIWADEIIKYSKDYCKSDRTAEIRAQGYDIPKVAKQMESMYMQI